MHYCDCGNYEPMMEISGLEWGRLETNEAVYCKRYFCGYGRNACSRIYRYCRLCKEMVSNDKNIGNSHEFTRHPQTLWEGSFWADERIPFSILPCGQVAFYNQSIARKLYSRNIQMPAIIAGQKQIYYSHDLVDCSGDEFVNMINDRLPFGNYECIVCGSDYDSFPTLKLVRRHLRICTGNSS